MSRPSPIVERLLARVRKSGDFPAMAQTVGLISQLTSSEATSSSALADTVLQDYGLTQKLLRLVNTATYAQYNQVTTITRAVLLMGFERIRNVATGLILFEHLQAQATTPALADALNMSFYSAILGRSIASRTGFVDPEEGFISALFHNLGRILVAFYLPKESQNVEAAPGEDRDAAVQRALGMSYAALGATVAQELSLPEKLTRAMDRVGGAQARESMGETERLACLATLANDITDVIAHGDEGPGRRPAVERLVRSYGRHFAGIEKSMDEIVSGAVRELREYSRSFRLNVPGSAFVNGLGEWRMEALMKPLATSGAAASTPNALLAAEALEAGTEDNAETVLTQGLHELTELLMGDFALDDVLRVILETIYRALGIGRSRVFFLLKDPSGTSARFRFGFGQSPSEMKAWFQVPLTGNDDVFVLSLRQQKDLVIKDTSSPDIASLLPAWYRDLVVLPRYVVLLPLVVEQKSLGLFYVDGVASDSGKLTPAILNYLKVLRGQAVVAIRTKTASQQRRRP